MATTPTASARRKHIHVRGIVQGVGFRPFVYNLAHSLGLTGYVFNSSSGVTIEIEGGECGAQSHFSRRCEHEPPQLSAIAEIAVSDIAACGRRGLLDSREPGGGGRIFADFARRRHLRRLLARLRRLRATGASAIPSPTAPTAARATPSSRTSPTTAPPPPWPPSPCALPAQAEYEDPADRRFHAQPNACAVCGPSLALVADAARRWPMCSFADRDSLRASSARRARCCARATSSPSKAWAAFCWRATRPTTAAVAELRRRKRRSAQALRADGARSGLRPGDLRGLRPRTRPRC